MHVTRYCGDDDEYDDDDDYDDDDQGDGDGGGRSAVAGFQFVDLVQTRCGPNGDPAGGGRILGPPVLGLHLVCTRPTLGLQIGFPRQLLPITTVAITITLIFIIIIIIILITIIFQMHVTSWIRKDKCLCTCTCMLWY